MADGDGASLPQAVPGAAGSRDAAVRSLDLLRASGDCVCLLNLQGRVSFANAVAREELRIGNAAGAVDWWSLWPRDAEPALRDAVEQVRGGDAARFTAIRPDAAGRPVRRDITASPIIGFEGRIEAVLVVDRPGD